MIVKRYAQNATNEKSIIPIKTARIHESIFFLFISRGVQIARKRVIIHEMERSRRMKPKLPVISVRRRSATSRGSIPNVDTKNCACSGWKTIYARKLQKNMTATKNIAPIHLRRVRGLMGSLFFWGGWLGSCHHPAVAAVGVVLDVGGISCITCGGTVVHCDVEMISERREGLDESVIVEKNLPRVYLKRFSSQTEVYENMIILANLEYYRYEWLFWFRFIHSLIF